VKQFVDISGVEVPADHTLRLTFADDTIGEVDFADHEWHGLLEPLRDPAFFAEVRVDPESGTVTWPNGIDLAPEPLYEEAKRNPA
jgi:hypothetical protein